MSLPTPESKESNLSLELLAWFLENQKRIWGALVLLSLVVVGTMVWRWNSARTEALASDALLAACRPPSAQVADDFTVPSDTLLKVGATYSGTRAAERALLLAAGQLFAEKNYGAAREKFDAFAQEYSESPFLPTALLGKASSLDALDQSSEALTAYDNLITRFPAEPVANRARLSKGRLLESLNKPAEALALYDEVGKAGTFTPTAQEAVSRREHLLQAHPELVKKETLTNASPATLPAIPLAPPPAQ